MSLINDYESKNDPRNKERKLPKLKAAPPVEQLQEVAPEIQTAPTVTPPPTQPEESFSFPGTGSFPDANTFADVEALSVQESTPPDTQEFVAPNAPPPQPQKPLDLSPGVLGDSFYTDDAKISQAANTGQTQAGVMSKFSLDQQDELLRRNEANQQAIDEGKLVETHFPTLYSSPLLKEEVDRDVARSATFVQTLANDAIARKKFLDEQFQPLPQQRKEGFRPDSTRPFSQQRDEMVNGVRSQREQQGNYIDPGEGWLSRIFYGVGLVGNTALGAVADVQKAMYQIPGFREAYGDKSIQSKLLRKIGLRQLVNPDAEYKGSYLIDALAGRQYQFGGYEYNEKGQHEPYGIATGKDPTKETDIQGKLANFSKDLRIGLVGLTLDIAIDPFDFLAKGLVSGGRRLGLIRKAESIKGVGSKARVIVPETTSNAPTQKVNSGFSVPPAEIKTPKNKRPVNTAASVGSATWENPRTVPVVLEPTRTVNAVPQPSAGLNPPRVKMEARLESTSLPTQKTKPLTLPPDNQKVLPGTANLPDLPPLKMSAELETPTLKGINEQVSQLTSKVETEVPVPRNNYLTGVEEPKYLRAGSVSVPEKPTTVSVLDASGTLVKSPVRLSPESRLVLNTLSKEVEVPAIRVDVPTTAVEAPAVLKTDIDQGTLSSVDETHVAPTYELVPELEADVTRAAAEVQRIVNKTNVTAEEKHLAQATLTQAQEKLKTTPTQNVAQPKTPSIPAVVLKGEIKLSELARLVSDNVPGVQVDGSVIKAPRMTKEQALELMRIIPAPDGKPIVSSTLRRIETWAHVNKILQNRGIEDPLYFRIFSRNNLGVDVESLKSEALRITVDPPTPFKASREVVTELPSNTINADELYKVSNTQNQKLDTSVKTSYLPGYEKPNVTANVEEVPGVLTQKQILAKKQALARKIRNVESPEEFEAVLKEMEELEQQLQTPDLTNPQKLEELNDTTIPEVEQVSSPEGINLHVRRQELEHLLADVSAEVNDLELQLQKQKEALIETLQKVDDTAPSGRNVSEIRPGFSPDEDLKELGDYVQTTYSGDSRLDAYEQSVGIRIAQAYEDIAAGNFGRVFDSASLSDYTTGNGQTYAKMSEILGRDVGDIVNKLLEVAANLAPEEVLKKYAKRKDLTRANPEKFRFADTLVLERLGLKNKNVVSNVPDPPTNKPSWFHGSSVPGWSPKDALNSETLHEWGQGLYLGVDDKIAGEHARAVSNTYRGLGGTPAVYELKVDSKNTLNVSDNASKQIKKAFADAIKTEFSGEPVSKRFVSVLRKAENLTTQELFSKFEQVLAKESISRGDEEVSRIYQAINRNLVSLGYDALTDGKTLKILNSDIVQVINTKGLDNVSGVESVASRYNADSTTAINNPDIPSAQTNHVESSAKLQTQLLEETERKLTEAKRKQLEVLDDLQNLDDEIKQTSKKERGKKSEKLGKSLRNDVDKNDKKLNKRIDNECEL